MKKKTAAFVSATLLATALLAACSKAPAGDALSPEPVPETAVPAVSTAALSSGSVTVYDFGETKLHVFFTNDALGDVAYIVEGADALVGIELPSFTEGLNAWKAYADGLGKPMDDIFLCSHPAGASYITGMNVYGTQGAKDSIASGSAYATAQGLYETFGEAFHGGSDIAAVNQVVSGPVTVAGISFNLIERGEAYDLEIPAINAVYTHMLGKTSHSILTSLEHMDEIAAALKTYQAKGYEKILPSHGGPEGQDAVAEKLSYIEKTRELAAANGTAADFIRAMQEAFPNYDGENYLEMTAGYLYQ